VESRNRLPESTTKQPSRPSDEDIHFDAPSRFNSKLDRNRRIAATEAIDLRAAGNDDLAAELDIDQDGASANRQSPRIIIIGAGMSGILAAIKFREAGMDKIVICEKRSDVGGVWRDNTYPGLKCDVPAHMFTYSFEPNPSYGKRFSYGLEIGQYLKRVSEKHDLRSITRFNTSIDRATFESGQWYLLTAEGETLVADVVICASGILHNPSFPEINGLDTFAGTSFHSAQWNHESPLEGKRVGIIGTGSTAVQVVSAITHLVGQMTVFQRTPHWIFPLPNRTYSNAYQERMRRWPALAKMSRYCYSKLYEFFFDKAVTGSKRMQRFIQWRCENYLRRKVKNPVLRKQLTPDFKAGCKRLILASGYFEAIQNPKTNLVSDRISKIVPDGVITADGKHHVLDVLIYATGFKAHDYMRPMKVSGTNGVTIDEVWSDFVFGHRSVAIPGFPNFFMTLGPHSPIGNFSAISVAEVQISYLLQLIEEIRSGRCDLIEPKKEVSLQHCEAMSKAMDKTVWRSGCQSWYFDDNGKTTMWPWSFAKFQSEMKRPNLNEYVLTKRERRQKSRAGSDPQVIFYRTKLPLPNAESKSEA